jgi:hypothetical protein
VCKGGEGTMVCLYARSDDQCPNNKIDNNRIMAIEIEKEHANQHFGVE